MNSELIFGSSFGGFVIAFMLLTKPLPYKIGVKFRKRFNYKPFNCLLCLTSWTSLTLYALLFGLKMLNLLQIVAILSDLAIIFGISLLFYLFINNFCNFETKGEDYG